MVTLLCFLRIIVEVSSRIVACGLLVCLLLAGYALFDVVEANDSSNIDAAIVSVERNTTWFTRLQEQNSNIIGWITITGTKIDYPLLKGDDNKRYLSTNYKEEYSIYGSAFMDYQNATPVSLETLDDYSIVYGHRSSNRKMFSDLALFRDADFLSRNSDGSLWLRDGVHKIKILGFASLQSDDKDFYDIKAIRKGKNEKILRLFMISSTVMNIKDSATLFRHLVLLSTCSGLDRTTRYVVLASIN